MVEREAPTSNGVAVKWWEYVTVSATTSFAAAKPKIPGSISISQQYKGNINKNTQKWKIIIKWSKVQGATSYEVKINENGKYKTIKTSGKSLTRTYNLKKGKNYKYSATVRAWNKYGEHNQWSGVASTIIKAK